MARRTLDPITETVGDLLAERGMPRTPDELVGFVRDVLDEMGLTFIPDLEDPDPDAPDDTLMGLSAAALGLAPRDDETDPDGYVPDFGGGDDGPMDDPDNTEEERTR